MRDDVPPEQTGALVIRVWLEPSRSQLLARITSRSDILSAEAEETSAVVAGSTAVTCVVRDWLAAFEQRARKADPPPDSTGRRA